MNLSQDNQLSNNEYQIKQEKKKKKKDKHKKKHHKHSDDEEYDNHKQKEVKREKQLDLEDFDEKDFLFYFELIAPLLCDGSNLPKRD